MKKYLLLIISLLCFSINVNAQAPSIEWQINIDLAASNFEGNCTKQTSDNGYISVGKIFSNSTTIPNFHGNSDFQITKLDNVQSLEWQKFLGGSNTDIAKSVFQTTDGGYIVAGQTNSSDGDVTTNHGNYDFWLVKINSNGNIQWQKTFGGTNEEKLYEMIVTTDGGYLMIGSTKSNDGDVSGNHGNTDIWVLKTDITGNIQWQKTYGGNDNEVGYSISNSSNGGYIIAGISGTINGDITNNNGSFDYWVIKTNDLGTIQWQKSYGGSSYDEPRKVIQASDGGYIVAGRSRSNNGNVSLNNGLDDFWILKLNNIGTIEWQKSYGGSSDEIPYSIVQDTNGNYIIVGYTSSINGDIINNAGNRDIWVIKLNNTGNLLWQKTIGGFGWDEGINITISNDNKYIITGFINSSATIIKLSSDILSTQEINKPNLAQIYPNPTQDFINIKSEENMQSISIIDLTGKQVFSTTKNIEKIDISALQKGMYLLKITTQNGITQTEKILKN